MTNEKDKDIALKMRYQFKVALLGDGAVGKTCIVNRFCFNEFFENAKMTIGLSFNSVMIEAKEQEYNFYIGLSIWDFGGQRQFRELFPQFLQGVNGAILCFDLNRFSSLENLLNEWKPMLDKYSPNAKKILVGTKMDLVNLERLTISEESINEYQDKLGVEEYFPTSSKENKNIKEIFINLTRSIVKDRIGPEKDIEIIG